ncbi:MAG: hypothetical protein D6828_04960, partial [Nitrospirae bacterium]
ILLLFMILAILMGTQNSYAHYNSAPNDYCYRCHKGGSAPAFIEVKGLPKFYVPKKRYMVTVIVESNIKSFGDNMGGFSVKAEDGKLIVSDEHNTQISGPFLTHTIEGAKLRKWTFIWQAPEEKKKTRIYIYVVAANGDFTPTGDSMGSVILTLSPKS